MAKLKKLLDQGIQPYRNFMIVNRGKQDEYYIDPLHERNGEMVKITPIAENMFFIFYICPNCCEVHSESKKVLNVDNKEHTADDVLNILADKVVQRLRGGIKFATPSK